MITKEQLKKIVDVKVYKHLTESVLDEIILSLNKTFKIYEINTSLRQCHFLAQIMHENGVFQYKEEIWGNTPAQLKYDTRVDLGNTPEKDGDGKLYKGRGWIQLTGKANYRAASKEFGVDFVKDPQKAAQYPYCALIAGWYWKKHSLNLLADKDDIRSITRKINGGYNGLVDRQNWLEKCKAVLIK